ncbi:MAG: flagellar hook-associated protein 1 FlgK [Porticoccaceae bacterium]|jgi:flagellar hook-associated protein 1 FlgK
MTDILNTGKSALFAFQRALSTTSHNIANVNTEGYSRQRVSFEATNVYNDSLRFSGSGVHIDNIERMHDQFATARVNSATSDHSQELTHFSMASRLDNLVATDGISVSPAINELFTAMQDANTNASSTASRNIVLDKTELLAERFQTLQSQLDDTQVETNARTREAVNSVNEYAHAIADINDKIRSWGASSQQGPANDLLDQRDMLVQKLSEQIEVNTVTQSNGAMNVYIGKGVRLVVGNRAENIKAVPDETYPDRLQIRLGEGNDELNLQTRLQGGEIGGLSDFSSQTLYPAMQALGQLALVMADAMNNQHAKGVDLNGDTGTALFSTPDPEVYSSSGNSGTGIVSAAIDDVNALAPSDYLLRYDGANFTATRTTDGAQTSGPIPLILDGMSLSITGTPSAGDTFIVSATTRAAGFMQSIVTDPSKLALASKLTTSSSISNTGDARVSDALVADPTSAALKDPINLVFSSDSTIDIIDANTGTTLSANVPYVSGETISVNGWEVSISGSAKSGDIHNIQTNTSGLGDNSNGLALADLQSSNMVEGNMSFNDAYGAMVSLVGSQTNTAATRASALESLKDNAIQRQQSTQGVSLDEEAINLTRYQQAYQASAQIISTADTMFQSILGVLR